MQKKILGVFFTLLLVGVLAMLYHFFNYTDNEVVTYKQYPSPIKEKKKISPTKLWIDNLAKSSTLQYSYPVNELFMQVDLQKKLPRSEKQKIIKPKSYKLVIGHIDQYSIFCVVQTLSNLNVPFVLTKDGSDPKISIINTDNKKLSNIVKELNTYQIKSKIIEE
ncbi:hypothetical protein [Sulfurospirillum sp. 1612]|uniref:hypothetical protein n=1 Tax=Sulfurospirillum sp. 1612 TaxID=3094835 RepID=UPI002F951766